MMTDIKRALTGKGFVAGAAGTIGVIAVSSLESLVVGARNPFLRHNGYHVQLITNALSGDALMMALPVLCALPFAAAFVDDMKSGFIKPFLHRAGIASYIKGKLIACGLSGGLVLFVGIVLAYGLSALVFIPLEQPSAPRLAEQAYIAQTLMTATFYAFSGALWSLAGFVMAALSMNRYVAYASPFIIYYLLIILHERYFPGFSLFYPKEWLFPSDVWALGNLVVLLLLAGLIILLCSAFFLIAGKKLAHV